MTVPPALPEIRLSSLAYTIDHWLPRPKSGPFDARDPFDLNAPYQRGSVWTDDQRRALIQSLYMGVPVGAIIVSVLPLPLDGLRTGPEGGDSAPLRPHDYRIVDGKQRLETVRAWCSDQLEVPGWWWRDGDIPDRTVPMVSWSGLTERGRRGFSMHGSLPALQFDGTYEYLGPHPDPKKGWRTRRRTDAELLREEARLYGLINGGGTLQSAEDMERAERVARGG